LQLNARPFFLWAPADYARKHHDSVFISQRNTFNGIKDVNRQCWNINQ
jgi:hypothetical protein